jgi:peptidoglycan-N-acetylglucosamine deacetylase
MHCGNHSDRTARRQCYFCKTPICPTCQKKAHHHIFCSDKCIQRFSASNETTDLPAQLQAIDESIAGDLKEYSSEVTESIVARIENLENALDRALTELATMLEGSAVAAEADLKKAQKEIETQFDEGTRAQIERSSKLSDAQEGLKQIALQTRELFLEVKEQIENTHKKNDQNAELFQNRLGHVEKQIETEGERALKRFDELHGTFVGRSDEMLRQIDDQFDDFEEHLNRQVGSLHAESKEVSGNLKEVHREIQEQIQGMELLRSRIDLQAKEAEQSFSHHAGKTQDYLRTVSVEMTKKVESLRELSKNIDSQSVVVDALKTKLENQSADIDRALQSRIGELQNSFQTTSSELAEQICVQLKKVVDDVALVAISQRGNWQEVVESARQGAVQAGRDARPEIVKRMNAEVEALARQQAKEIGKSIEEVQSVLKKKVRGIGGERWKYAAAACVGVIAGMLAIYLPQMFQPKQTVIATAPAVAPNVDQKMSELDASLRSWVTEKLASIASSKTASVENSLIPVSAMTRGKLTRKEVAFTFDAGSNANAASEILDTLKAKNIHSTMFLTGAFIDQYPDVVRRIASEGHEAGNHLLEHNHVVDPKTRTANYTKADFLKQLHEVENKYRVITGKEMTKFWRAPYGDVSQEVITWAAEAGYRHIGWTRTKSKNLDTMDWVVDPKNNLYKSAEQIAAKILTAEKDDPNGLNGAVVLMHLGTERKTDQPHKKLAEIFEELSRRGYQITPVSSVLQTDVALK